MKSFKRQNRTNVVHVDFSRGRIVPPPYHYPQYMPKPKELRPQFYSSTLELQIKEEDKRFEVFFTWPVIVFFISYLVLAFVLSHYGLIFLKKHYFPAPPVAVATGNISVKLSCDSNREDNPLHIRPMHLNQGLFEFSYKYPVQS